MKNLDQAREWAEKYQRHNIIVTEAELAAVEVIQSLPDHWIDAKEIQKWYDQVEGLLPYWAREDFKSLIAPKLPTLADMTHEERKACQWMQAKIAPTNKRSGLNGVIAAANPSWIAPGRCLIWAPDGSTLEVLYEDATPLTGEPKMKWPGSGGAEDAPVTDGEPTLSRPEEVKPGDYRLDTPAVDDEPDLPRPEDVPAGEAWRVKLFRYEVNALKTNHPQYPWSVSGSPEVDGRTAYANRGVTLVSRLVPGVNQ